MPSCCRGIAISTPNDLQTITVYVPLATSHEAIQNLGDDPPQAGGHRQRIRDDNFAAQFKGEAIDTRLAREDEAAFARVARSTPSPTCSTASAFRGA